MHWRHLTTERTLTSDRLSVDIDLARVSRHLFNVCVTLDVSIDFYRRADKQDKFGPWFCCESEPPKTAADSISADESNVDQMKNLVRLSARIVRANFKLVAGIDLAARLHRNRCELGRSNCCAGA